MEKDIQYAGQPIGVIVAKTHMLANEAVKKVKVSYADVLKTKPVLTLKDVIASADNSRILPLVNVPAKRKGSSYVI